MKWKVRSSNLSGTIAIPPSKSHTIRALLIASLADGKSKIGKPLMSGDGASAIRAAESIGAKINVIGKDIEITGIGSDYDKGETVFDMGNSGTGTNLFASAASLGSKLRRFDGDSSLRSRPFKPLLDSLSQLGAHCNLEAAGRDLPFTLCGPLIGGTTSVNGISSQFLSSLLLACPLIVNGETTLNVYNLHEKPYVEITLWWLSRQNIRLEYDSEMTRFHIPGNQKYSPFDLTIPADFSSATFAAVGGALTGSSLKLTGLDFSDPQGDKQVFDILDSLGVEVRTLSDGVIVNKRQLRGGQLDLNKMPDALPALSVLACAAEDVVQIVNVKQARIKETDRITVMQQELTKMGADIEEREDGLVIKPCKLKGAIVNGHDDHRVVMALALAGMIADGETVIETAEAADVTYPGFVDDFKNIGADIEVIR
jgi:3-phosphoshikimate 1-carboxyvinyltransferase